MCEKCEADFNNLPTGLIDNLELVRADYMALQDRMARIMQDAQVVETSLLEVDSDNEIDQTTLTQEQKDAYAAGLKQLHGLMGMAYAFGFFGASDCQTHQDAADHLGFTGQFVNTGVQHSLWYSYVLQKVKH